MNKKAIAPSILSADFLHLKEQIDAVTGAGAQYIHFDVMDGMFVENISFGIPLLESIRPATDAVLDVHLMIVRPEHYVDAFIDKGADIVTFHYEASSDIAGLCEHIRARGKKAGVSIRPATPAEALYPYLEHMDLALVMSVEPGFGGQSFQEGAIEKIQKLRREADRRGLSVLVEVDGGVTAQNAGRIAEAGTDILVAGSAVFKGDAAGNTTQILNTINGEL